MNSKFLYELKPGEQARIIPLAIAYPGQKVRVVSIVAGRGLRQRLISTGLNNEFYLECTLRIKISPKGDYKNGIFKQVFHGGEGGNCFYHRPDSF